MQVEGLHVRVDKASERRASKKDDAGVFYHPGRTIFVGNLPFDATVSLLPGISRQLHWNQHAPRIACWRALASKQDLPAARDISL